MSTTSRLGIRSLGYVIVFARDMGRSIAFYRDTLGLAVKAESPHWAEFDVGGTILALHGMEPGAPPAPVPARDPGETKSAPVEIVFSVDDPIAARAAATRAGVRVAAPKIVFEAGEHVGVSCLFVDPDGNLLSLFGVVPRAHVERAQG